MNEGTVCLPYVKGLSEKLRNVYNNYGIRAAFKCGRQVKESGSCAKSSLGDRKNNVVYQIGCLCGGVYIGQTERMMKTRHNEHEADIRLTRVAIENGNMNGADQRMASSKLVDHCVNGCGLFPDWDNVKVIGVDRNWTCRRLRETYHTVKGEYMGKLVINDTDILIDESWKGTMKLFWDKENGVRS